MLKKTVSIILAAVLLLASLTGCVGKEDTADSSATDNGTETGTNTPAPADHVVTDLRVDFEKHQPLAGRTPLFSWALETDARGVTQTAYRIRVAKNEDALSSGDLVWDSGKVSSSESSSVAFGGNLEEAAGYCWNVTVTTDRGAEVTSGCDFFETALFESGFNDASWIIQNDKASAYGVNGANWIWLLNGDSQGNIDIKTEYFRKKINIDKKISSAVIIYTADDYGKLYFNGEAVSEVTEASGWKHAVFADVTHLVRRGSNTIACYAVNNQFGYGAVIVKMLVEYADGSSQTFVSDESWKASEKASGDWYTDNADESGFSTVNSVTLYGGRPWNSEVDTIGADNAAPMVRGEFEVSGQISSARLYASAAGLYEAYINGEKAGNSVLDPGRSEYNKRVMYQCTNVTEAIKEGKNVVGAVLGRGWYIGAYSPYGGTVPAFICKLVIDYKDGKRQVISTDGSWKSSTEGPVLYNDIFNGETYDARREIDGWSSPAFDASAWDGVSVTNASVLGIGELVPQLSGTVKVMDRVTAKSVDKIGNGVYIYDFGQNLAGVVSLKMKGAAGKTVTLRHGEMLNDGNKGSDGPKGTLYTQNLRSALATDKYTFRGDENGEEYSPTFTFHGFRYLELSGLSDPLPLSDVTALVWYSDMEDTGSIRTSDDLVNKLVSNTYWGQRGNFLSTPTDCPQRDERMGWSGDAQIFAGTAAYNMNVKAFFDKYITDLNDCQHSDGSYPDVAPETGRANYTGSGNNAWADAGVIIPWIMYTRYGDASYIVKYYENMKKYARYLLSTSNNYIRSVSAYGDWLSIGESTNVAVTDTAYCVYVMDLMTKMATLLGKSTDAAKFTEYADSYRAAWRKSFVSAGKGRLKVDTQTAYLVALAFDIIPDGDKQAFADRLNDKITGNKNKLTTGFIGCPLLLPVLCEYGHTDTAFALLQQEDYPSWKYPILQGATTIWERWNSYTKADGFGNAGMNSFNHYSYGSVTEWIYSTLCGICCDENAPGFSHFILRPTCGGGIDSAEGEYKSLKGTIRSGWKAESGVIKEYVCTVPGNTSATLYLKAPGVDSVTEGGKSLAEAEGIRIVSESEGVLVLELGSGNYSFKIK